jgi:hypothetical protein
MLLVKVENDPLTVGDVFRLMGSVSWEDNRRLFRYFRQVPQDFKYSYSELVTFAWACKNRMKLGGVVSFNSIGRLSLNLYMYMMKSCDISDMHTLACEPPFQKECDGKSYPSRSSGDTIASH